MDVADYPIAMDGRFLDAAEGTGVAHYARVLHKALAHLTPCPGLIVASPRSTAVGRTVRWANALWPAARQALDIRTSGEMHFESPDIYRMAQVFFDIHRRPLTLRIPGPTGIVHWSYPLPIVVDNWSNLYTIHDLIPLESPDLTPISPRRHRRLLEAITPLAAGIVTVSQSSRDAIADLLDFPTAQIFDCGEAVEGVGDGNAPLPDALETGSYFLVLGTVERRKNIERLIEAHRRAATGLKLVIVGADGWRAPKTEGPDIVRYPYMATATVATLLRHARALLMPSLAEGFGLPIVEAMSVGTPVITSRNGALEEVAAGSAMLVDPQDVDALAGALRAVAGDKALCTRLSAAGLRNAQRFDAETFQCRLADAYSRVWRKRTSP